MATIQEYGSQLLFTGKGYLDAAAMPVANHAEMLAIPTSRRFKGLEVVVLSDETQDGRQTKYWLVGGTTNSKWVLKNDTSVDPSQFATKEMVQDMYDELNEKIDKIQGDSHITASTIEEVYEMEDLKIGQLVYVTGGDGHGVYIVKESSEEEILLLRLLEEPDDTVAVDGDDIEQ